MLADDASCNSRNKVPGSVYASPGQHLDLYGDNIEVDYRGYEVTVENFIRVLTGKLPCLISWGSLCILETHDKYILWNSPSGLFRLPILRDYVRQLA
jgi:hypothetical protein